jgi:hypothetical protein
MKRGGFIKRRTPLRNTRKSSKNRPRKLATKGYVVPAWFMKIKPGTHGSTPAQKRLWKVVSDYVRQRDFELYGDCVSCGEPFQRWNDAQAGHWLPFSLCNAIYKFDPTFNIAAQCMACNSNLRRSGAHIGHAMGEELKRRFGPDILTTILTDNRAFHGMKLHDYMCVDFAEKLLNQVRPI